MATTLTPILTKFWDAPQSWTLATYEDNEGYQALKKAFGMSQEELVNMTKDSGLRGRGGAGFPTARKWQACRDAAGDLRVVVCNADEGEPGTFKDRVLLASHADAVFDGMTMAARAVTRPAGVSTATSRLVQAMRCAGVDKEIGRPSASLTISAPRPWRTPEADARSTARA